MVEINSTFYQPANSVVEPMVTLTNSKFNFNVLVTVTYTPTGAKAYWTTKYFSDGGFLTNQRLQQVLDLTDKYTDFKITGLATDKCHMDCFAKHLPDPEDMTCHKACVGPI